MDTQTKDERRYTYQEYREAFFPTKEAALPECDDPFEIGVALSKIILEQVKEQHKTSIENCAK